MIKLFKNLVAITLIITGGSLLAFKNIEIDISGIVDLKIEKPSEKVIVETKPIVDIVTDKNDRIKMAIFNQEFAKRLLKYDTDIQKANDVYVLAGEFYFKNDLKGKYPQLADNIVSMIKGITGDDNHILSQEEKQIISDKFMGLAWSLLKKR